MKNIIFSIYFMTVAKDQLGYYNRVYYKRYGS